MAILSYKARAQLCRNPTAKQLLELMEEKKSNLSLAADVETKEELLQLARTLGPEICVLKTHIDMIKDFDQELTQSLKELAEKHHFLIFEDRKFADIGNTVKAQYQSGIYHIADWAHITNAHSVPGPGIIDGLKEVGLPKGRGLLLLAEMSSKGTLAEGDYTQKTVAMAKDHPDFVIGFIARQRLVDNPVFITLSPGVKFAEGGDKLGQQYLSPENVIIKNQSDVIIVGRDIINSADPLKAAQKYREAGWKAYQDRSKVT